ncbi:hypothetical protein [Allostreptomyces psammosilenae]|uniref:Uncharacterized protein n=1 Tax=Allostreptomyces psammosilenae TaxID=1892865 RepID=A0A853A7Q2_9ACTN|nr:hypothetical protein [Allostreptomyces psammosilenae]NYI06472.1 hypothetical protein [Allostreptomyces psammosilenae]
MYPAVSLVLFVLTFWLPAGVGWVTVANLLWSGFVAVLGVIGYRRRSNALSWLALGAFVAWFALMSEVG